MLLVKRFATLGAVMAIPMFANILMITISLHWQGTPYVVTFFLLCNIFLLIYDYHKIKFLVTDDSKPIQKIPIKRNDVQLDILYIIGLIIILIAVSVRGLGDNFSKILAYIGLGSFILVYGFGLWKNRKI
jgi:Ca2+/Na+ antiporter